MSGGSSLVAVAVAVLLLNFAVEEVQSQGSCDVLGVSHAHNDTILMSSSFGCTRLLCENGVLRIVYRGCEVDLECKPENTTYRDLNCREFRCARSSPTSNIYSVVHVKTYCLGGDGVCETHPNVTVTTQIVDGRLQINCRCLVVAGLPPRYDCDELNTEEPVD
ncbi:hypothetical protein BsWGS_03437 [Bradybaena similaris]